MPGVNVGGGMVMAIIDGSLTRDLIFEVTEEADGGFCAECLTESIVTQGNNWNELRANLKEATEAFFYDGPKPKFIRLHFVRNEVLVLG